MLDYDKASAERASLTISEMQNRAFEVFPLLAEQYVDHDHSTAVYVQEALFALTSSQKADEENLRDRQVLMKASEGTIVLFPGELTDLRLRAAYHGAGLATEQDHDIPRAIKHRLSDNLNNYSSTMEYEQQYLPWSYKFKVGALKSILLHDYKIAASDCADGDLHRISNEQDDEFA
jgi:hypothetical protein